MRVITDNIKQQQFRYDHLNSREFITCCSLVGIALFGITIFSMIVWSILPQPQYLYAGQLSDFPILATPRPINQNGYELYVVNIGSELIAFDRHVPHYYGRLNRGRWCLIEWIELTWRFEDPCYGSKFAIDGSLLYGPATRNLDRFAVKVKNEQVWIEISQVLFGVDICSSFDRSKYICSQQNEFTKY